MAVRIGANPIMWSNDDDATLGGDISVDTCLSEARAAGYEGIELGNKLPRTAAALRPLLQRHGLALVSGWYSTFLLQRDVDTELVAAAEHRRVLRDMGCSVMIVAECARTAHPDPARPLSTRPVLGDADWRLLLPRLTRLAERLAAEGLTLAYHHHVGTVVQSGEEIDRLMRGTGPAVRLLLDTGHATWGGADPVALARTWRARIAHVHVKDVRASVAAAARRADWSFLRAVREGVFTVPGDGCIDFSAVLRELPGYSGWIVVEAEQDPAKAPPATYARIGYEGLTRAMRDAGL